MTPPMMAFLGKFISLSGFFVIAVSGATIYSSTSAFVPLIYLMNLTLLLSVNLNMRLAVISFLLITASTPMLSARRIYSIFSTSAITLAIPRLFAATHARILVSELFVTATKASYSFMDSSRSMSELRPSPFTTITLLGRLSDKARHFALFISMSFTESSTLAICFATISPIGLPPRIITLFTSMFLFPIYFISISIPSRFEMMNTRS